MKHSVSWWCFVPRPMTPEAFVQTVARIGYDGIDLVEPPYLALVRDAGLQIASIRGHESIEHGLNRSENHARIERELSANIELAAQWSVSNLVCFSGNRAGLSDDAGIDITAEGLSRVAKKAEDAGVTLVLELLNSKVDHPDYQCDRTAWGVEVCKRVGSPHVRLLYDIYHMQIMEGDVIRTIRDYHAYIGHYHTAGNPGRNEIDDTQELNYRAIARAIHDTGYDGYLGQEFVPTRDPVAALQAALDICTIHD